MRLVLVGTSYQQAPVELRELLAYDRDLRRGASCGWPRTGARRRSSPPATAPRSTSLPTIQTPPRGGSTPSSRRLSGLSESELAPAALHARRPGGRAPPLPRRRRPRLDGARARRRSSARCARPTAAAREAATAGPILHRLFRQALRVGKRVRTETAIGENPASVSSAAAELAERVFDDLADRRILLLGAGKIADLTAAQPHLARRRRDRRRQPLAGARRGARAALRRPRRRPRRARGGARAGRRRGRLDRLAGLRRLGGAGRRAPCAARRGRPVFFIDIAVPRDLDPAVNELEGCYLYDIDDLERVVAESVAGRRDEAVRAEAIVSHGGGRLPRLAALARRRPGDRLAARAGRGDPPRRARARRRAPRVALPEPAASRSSR